MFTIQCLTYEDMDIYIQLLHERYYWLKEHKVDMWTLEKLGKNALYKRYIDPQCYVGYENSECVGGFLLIEQDPRYWPNNLHDNAFYFHKFVVSPRFGGKGYSSKMLEWVKVFGKEKGKNYIRLDYQKSRSYLRNMYLRHGFVDIDEIENDEGKLLILGEYRIG
jgi:GNAT superfamily N-acetyltransferase